MFSLTTRYALRAAVLLAELGPEDRPATVGEMAEALGIPRNYLSKTLHSLAKRGVLTSGRGPSGGFRLALPPEELALSRIVDAVEPGLCDQACLLGRPVCSDADPCSAHVHWRRLTGELDRFLDETTVADLVRRESAKPRPSKTAKTGGKTAGGHARRARR
ncbi:MAG: Rrf2 family transcriptional regulator [Myxococcota bacterium]